MIIEIIKKNHVKLMYPNCELRLYENMKTGEKTWYILDNRQKINTMNSGK